MKGNKYGVRREGKTERGKKIREGSKKEEKCEGREENA